MPAPKKVTADIDTADIELERRDFVALLGRVGVLIRTLNANGKRSDKFCRLCGQARLLKVPCVHTEVWRLAEGR